MLPALLLTSSLTKSLVMQKEEGGVRWSLLEPAINTLKQALVAEQSQPGMKMRGLRFILTQHEQQT